MTREEAKAYAKRVIDLGLNDETQAFCEVVLEVLEQEPCEDWHDVPSDEMTLGQARQAVKDLRKKLAEYLWQTPCKDAISRQEVLDVIERWLECSGYNEAERHIMRAVQSVLYDSPSVTPQMKKIRVANIDFDKEKFMEIMKNAPITILDDSNTPTIQLIQPKTGHWIAVENDEMETVGYYCSECDLPMETEHQTKFCPNCGARMIEPQESEE